MADGPILFGCPIVPSDDVPDMPKMVFGECLITFGGTSLIAKQAVVATGLTTNDLPITIVLNKDITGGLELRVDLPVYCPNVN